MKSLFSCLYFLLVSLHVSAHALTPIQKSSGYAISHPQSITDVSGSWKVPILTPVGTTSECQLGVAMHSSQQFHDLYPRAHTQVYTQLTWNTALAQQQNQAYIYTRHRGPELIPNFPVDNNDIIHAEIKYIGKKKFKFTATNHTKNITITLTRKENGMRMSPAWPRQDAPSIALWAISKTQSHLANFGIATFYNCFLTVQEKRISISHVASPYDLYAFNSGNQKIVQATPSALESHGKFHVTWIHE